MQISIVIPTLGIRNSELYRLMHSLKDQTHKDIQILIVSQDNHNFVSGMVEEFKDNLNIEHIISEKKGLSLARNIAIPFISGDIVTFSDDDCWYPSDSFQKVLKGFEKMKEADGICFQIFDPEKSLPYKNYSNKVIPKMNLREIFKRSSIEIFLNVKKISQTDLKFHESFGLGAKYPSGEENILLANLNNKGYCLSYINDIVVYHAKPTQESRLNLNSFKSKGPLFKQIFGSLLGFVMLSALFLKKIKYLDKPFSFYYAAIKEMVGYKRGE